MTERMSARPQRINLLLFGTAMGALWMVFAIVVLPQTIQLPAGIAVILVGGALAAFVHRAAPALPERQSARRGRRWFLGSVVLEMALISAGYAACLATNHGDLMLPVLGAAVGLHLLPMAIGFRSPSHAWVGCCMLAIVAISFLIVPPGRSVFIGLANGLLFWAGIELYVSLARSHVRRARPELRG